MSEAVIIALIGLVTGAFGLHSTYIKIKPDTAKTSNENTQYVFNSLKDANNELRAELKEFKEEAKVMKEEFEEVEEELSKKLEETKKLLDSSKQELEFANAFIIELEEELKVLKSMLKGNKEA